MNGIENMASNMTSHTGSIGSSASTIQNTAMSAYPLSAMSTQSSNKNRFGIFVLRLLMLIQ